jgi:histidinol-phosphatase (PHP family)
MLPEDACKKALDLGLEGIGFTDHYEYFKIVTGENPAFDFEKQQSFIDSLRVKYDSKIKVLKGVEVDIQPQTLDNTKAMTASNRFDYIIGSIHIIDGWDPYLLGYYEGKSKYDAYQAYLEKIYYMITNFGDLDIVGHIDYITRYPYYDDRTLRYNDHKSILDSILEYVAKNNKGLELNTKSFFPFPGKNICSPDMAIYARYKQLGGQIVCLGSDAHRSDAVGYRFDEFAEFLRAAGFKYAAYYENKEVKFSKL